MSMTIVKGTMLTDERKITLDCCARDSFVLCRIGLGVVLMRVKTKPDVRENVEKSLEGFRC